MAAESVDVGHMSHGGGNSGDHNGGVVSKHETGSNASGSISRRKQQLHNSNGLLIARSNLDMGSVTGGVNNNNSKMHNGKYTQCICCSLHYIMKRKS